MENPSRVVARPLDRSSLARPSLVQRSLIPRSPLARPALAHPPLAPGWPRPCSSLTRPALARHSLGAGSVPGVGNLAFNGRCCSQIRGQVYQCSCVRKWPNACVELRIYASALVHRRPCLPVGVYIHTHMCTYLSTYREGGMRTFMEEMTLVIGPYMEQKTRPMKQIMHCKNSSLGHCEGSVDKLRASSVQSSPLPPVPMLMGIEVGSSCAHNIG